MSVEEYLTADVMSGTSLEYHGGEVFPIAEATLPHGLLVINVGALLRSKLKNSGCRADADMRVRIDASHYVKPDVLFTVDSLC